MSKSTHETAVMPAVPARGAEIPASTWTGLLALCRVSNLPTVWMNVVTAIVLSGATDPLLGGILLLASMSAFYTSGMALNDVFDAGVDQRSQPFRPIPSGRVTIGQAMAFAVGLLLIGLLTLLATPQPSAIVPGLVLGVAIVVYDRYHKAHAWTIPVMASCRLLVFLTCAWAMTGTIRGVVLGAGGLQFTYTLLITVVARREGRRGVPYHWPVVPNMIAAMCLVDGLLLAVTTAPVWLLPAAAAAALTRLGQRFLVRGD